MLVYARNPMGVLYLPNGITVYGASMRRSPSDVSLAVYETYSDCLVDATYRSYNLEKQFGRSFSPVAFKISELDCLPYPTLQTLGSEIGVLDRKRFSRTNLVRAIKCALRHGCGECRRCHKRFSRGHPQQAYCTKRCMKKASNVA